MSEEFSNPSTTPTPPPVPQAQPRPQGRGLLWLILALQAVILGWLAKNQFDGTSQRGGSFPSSPAVPAAAIPPSLECDRDVPSPSAPAPDADDPADADVAAGAPAPAAPAALPPPAAYHDPFALFRRSPRPSFAPRSFPRWHADVQRMMDEAMEAHEAMLQDFGSFFSPGPEWAALPASPAVNMRELDDAYELTLARSGLAPDDLDVRLDGRTLSLRYDRRTDTADANGRQTGRQSGSVCMGLPGPVAPGAVPEISNDNDRIRIRIAKPGAPATPAAATAAPAPTATP